MKNTNIFDFGVEDTHFNYLPTFPNTKRIKLFEAFAGIGCQAMALKRLGIDFESVGISEIDKYAIMSYNAIHGETKNYGDICKMETIPECDIFTWSFPCTDLSKAGKQNGLDGTRSGLVYEVIRLLENTKKKPQVLIMENVVDLVQVKFASAFYEIQKTIESLGYTNYTRTLNAKDYGVAQNRERVFMVSILGNYRYEFPLSMPLELRLKDYLEEEVDEKYYLSDVAIKGFQKAMRRHNLEIPKTDDEMKLVKYPHGNFIGGEVSNKISPTIDSSIGARNTTLIIGEPKIKVLGNYTPNGKSAGTIVDKKGIAPTVMWNHGTPTGIIEEHNVAIAGQFQPKDRGYNKKGIQRELNFELRKDAVSNAILTNDIKNCIAIPEATIKGYALAEDGDGVYLNRPHQKRGVVQKGMIQTLKTSGDDVGVVVENLRIRKLTPRECWRLMGISKPLGIYHNKWQLFDDTYFERASKVCSNSQLYKQAGNGIVVDVFQKILEGLFEKEKK